LDYEAPTDVETGGVGNNVYNFDVVYTNASGDKFTETVALTVTDGAEQVVTVAGVNTSGLLDGSTGTTEVKTGDVFNVDITRGGTTYNISYTHTASDTNYTLSELAAHLQLDADAATAGATFSVSNTNDLVVTFADSVGTTANTVSQLSITRANGSALGTGGTASTTGVTAVSGVQHELTVTGLGTALVALNTAAGPAAGDRFEITVAGHTFTTTADIAGGTTQATVMTNLVGALNTLNGGTVPGTFSTDGTSDDLIFTYTGAGAQTATMSKLGVKLSGETSFGQTVAALGTLGGAGSDSVTTAGVTAITGVAEVNTLSDVAQNLRSVVKSGDTFAIGDGTNTITATIGTDFAAANNFSLANLATALNARVTAMEAATAGSAGNFANGSFSASGNNLLFTYSSAGAQTSVTLTGVTFTASSVSAGAVATTNAGTATNATNAVSTQATSTAGTASSTLASFQATGSNVVNASKATVTLAEAKSISIGADARSAAFTTFVGANAGGTYTIGGTDGANFTVNSTTGEITNNENMDYETDTSHTFDLIYTAASGAKFTETFTLNLTDVAGDNGSYVADIDMSTKQGAYDAIEILDFAINQISASQSKLGAIQNRLQHNIDNLSMAAMVTETAKGRITDADYARETSELSKQQILSQAATSMLAQANQSKQGVLALLQ
jgi:flagellin